MKNNDVMWIMKYKVSRILNELPFIEKLQTIISIMIDKPEKWSRFYFGNEETFISLFNAFIAITDQK